MVYAYLVELLPESNLGTNSDNVNVQKAKKSCRKSKRVTIDDHGVNVAPSFVHNDISVAMGGGSS